MRDVTEKLIQSVSSIPWCRSVGALLPKSVIQVYSWDEAAAYASSDRSVEVNADMANEIRSRVRKVSVSRYNEWNEVPIAVRPEINRLVAEVLAKCELTRHPHCGALEGHMKWTLMHWVIETEYSDIVAPAYFTMLGEFYKAGHFPCGWQGESGTEGLPVVY